MKTSDDAFDADIDLDEEETLEEEGLEGEELTARRGRVDAVRLGGR